MYSSSFRNEIYMKISILGPCWPYRGGIAAFSERLAHQFQAEGHQVMLYTYTLQYPSFLFPGTTQYSTAEQPSDLQIERKLSSVNPFTWLSLGNRIKKESPDLLILAYWMPFMAPCQGSVARIVRGNHHTKVVALCHNFIPHETRPGDMILSRYLLGSIDGVAALSQSVCDDVHRFKPAMKTVASPHPLYDNFGDAVERGEACRHLGLDPHYRYLLFFGLIRDYKGLDWLLEAFSKVQSSDTKLIVAGEFYSDGEKYHALADKLQLNDRIVWCTRFVPDAEVRYYFGAADLIVQPYKTATQSGVTQIAYHFEKPMLVTRVGGLAEIVPDGKVGYTVEPDIDAIAEAIGSFVSNPQTFTEGIRDEKKKYKWERMTTAIISLNQ